MKVSIKLDVTDETRQRIRARSNRAGKATRDEFKKWLQEVIRDQVAALPAPKTRGAKPSPSPSPEPDKPQSSFARQWELADAAPEEAICKRCGKPKRRHGKTGFICPPVEGKPRGKMFEASDDGT